MLKKQIICNFPIQFLQDNLYGIMTGDFIMLCASTGVGKSTISRLLVQKAMYENVPAVLYSLEDEPETFVADNIYRQYLQETREPLPYRRWLVDYTNTPDKYAKFAKAAAKLEQKIINGLPAIQIHEMKTPAWTIREVIAKMEEETARGYKLFILDHVDVLVPSERPADTTRAMMALWDFVARKQIALITFSQLASGRNLDSLCPGINDLRGSKNKVNTPTIVLSLAKHDYGFYSDESGKPTYLRILKNRQGGECKCAVVYFQKGKYATNYREVKCNASGTTIDGETMKSLITKGR